MSELPTHAVRVTNPFTAEAKRRGWKMQDIAKRWGITPRQMSYIAKSPSQRDWDALNGLPHPVSSQNP